MAQTDPNDTVYKSSSLSKWFAIGSLLLFVGIVWAVVDDYNRSWKKYARQNQKIVAAINQAKLTAERGVMDQEKLANLRQQITEFKSQNDSLAAELDAKIKNRDDVYFRENQIYQAAKGKLDADLFLVNNAVKKLDPKAPKLRARWDADAKKVRALFEKAMAAEKSRDAAIQERVLFLASKRKTEDQIANLTADAERLEKVIFKNEANITNLVRNAPVIDFIAPTVKVNQIVLPHLKDDYFFNKVPRVDRCMTCHANADKPGFEDLPQPFTSHPKLGLYLASDSPHPVETIGCTVCHAGIPQSMEFSLAGHTPKDAIQESEWIEKYGYFRPKHLPTPMIPTAMTEGKCIQCHASNVTLEDAPTFNAGMRMVEKFGCYGCHKFAGHFETLSTEKKTGPSLTRVASKLNEDWVKKFIWEPKSYRPSSTMPAFWKTHNNSDPESLARGAVEVDAIAHYLFKKSKPYEPIKLASKFEGDIARGKELTGSVGCLACHAIADFPRTNPTDPNVIGHKDPRVPMFGPELNQMGSKVTQEWLVSWLINPKHYWDNTAMPSMKLSEQEATDIAVYLLDKRNARFEQLEAPVAADGVRDMVVYQYLQPSMSNEEAKVKLASMSLDDKKLYLGEKLIGHYGCYGCHAIEGFENAPKIGAELTYQGSKDITKFDFANVKLPKSRADWVYTKIRTPRVWDVGKTSDFEGKTRMPHFGFTHEQATAITAIVLGYENRNVAKEAIFKVDGRWEQIIEGQRVLNRHNCMGCHAMEGMGGEILAHYPDDPSEGPPNLNTEGQKIQTQWLYAFLLNPDVMIRPWVKARMPNFMMTEKESLQYTKYFAAWDRASYPYQISPYRTLSPAEKALAQAIIEQHACLSCHAARKPGDPVADAAPVFENVKGRLRGPWIPGWLKDPAAIMPGTRMPQLWPPLDAEDPKSAHMGLPDILGGDAEAQMQLVSDYLMQYPGDAKAPSAPVHLKNPTLDPQVKTR